VSVFFDALLPDLDLLGVEAVEVLLNACIELLGIPELLTVLHTLSKCE
jgi:hypothetical protein